MIKSKGFLKTLFKPLASNSSKGEVTNEFNSSLFLFVYNISMLCSDGTLSKEDPNQVDLEKLAAQEQKHFPFEILVAATNNFHPSLKLGEGGFGPVFKVGRFI